MSSLIPSVYGEQEAMLDLANTYLQPNSFSTLKAGFLGYMTGNMARVAAEGIYHRDIMYGENFLNTASMARSIYKYAKIYDYPITVAKPARCHALIGLYVDEIQAALGSDIGTLRLPRGQALFMGSTQFVTAGAVVLSLLSQGRVSANYDLSEMDFTETNQDSYIRTYVSAQVVDEAGSMRTVIYMDIAIHQAVARATQFQVISSDTLENSVYRVAVPTGEQMAKFRVLYKPANTDTFREIETIFNETSSPTTPEYCFYSYETSGQLEIRFSALPGDFRPAYNSALRVEFLTTTGTAGNFDFTGTPVITIANESLTTQVSLVTQPAGGYDGETLMQIKRGILRKILERKNIIIETDLESYLTDAVDATTVNDSFLTFIKRRDDLQTRLFAAYLVVRDNAGRIVPTNTVNLDFEVSDLERLGWSLRPGTLIVYDRRNSIYRLLADGEYPDRMVSDPNSFVYCIPFLMQFQTRPAPRMVYYRNQANIGAALASLPGAIAAADSFIANSVTVVRNSTFDSVYQIDMTVSSSLSADEMGAKCIVRALFIGDNNAVIGYTECQHISGTSIFRAAVSTNDSFDESSRLILVNSLYDNETDTLMPSASIPEKIKIRLELYYDSADTDVSVTHIQRDGRVYQLTHIFQTVEQISLYQSLERVMSSGMHVTSAGTFHCTGVPVIGASFFLNPRIGQESTDIIERYHSAILNIFDLLHNNTSVDVKLYNTYGPSKAFNLDRVNISLAFEVRPRTRPSDELKTRIIKACAAFVQKCNENEQSRFSISNLTTHIENTITDVSFMKFVGLNGVAAQNAELIYTPAALAQDNKRIPEFLNVATILQNSLSQDPYVAAVQIQWI